MIQPPYSVWTAIGRTGKRVTVKARTMDEAEAKAAQHMGVDLRADPEAVIVRYRYTVAGVLGTLKETSK